MKYEKPDKTEFILLSSGSFLSFTFDNIRTRLQNNIAYKDGADCFRRTLAKEGLIGIHRGFFIYYFRNIAALYSALLIRELFGIEF